MIRLTRKRLIVSVVVLFVLGSGLWITWEVCDWPPVRLIIKYGFPPAGGPTGRRRVVDGIEFIEVSPGYFRMGSYTGPDTGGLLWKVATILGLSRGSPPRHGGLCSPPHWVEIGSRFWMAREQVSRSQMRRWRVDFPVWDDEDGHRPALFVSWEDAKAFCDWFSRQNRVRVRLPSEAEWEFVCRTGTDPEHCARPRPKVAREVLTQVDGPEDTEFSGFHSNLREWCEDAWHGSFVGAPADGSAWDQVSNDTISKWRVLRGGCMGSTMSCFRSTDRFGNGPHVANFGYTFRPVMTNEPDRTRR